LTMTMTMTMTWRSLSKVWKTILFISNLSLNKTQTLFQLKWLLSFFQHFLSFSHFFVDCRNVDVLLTIVSLCLSMKNWGQTFYFEF
jgi:hypothetical protein